PDTTAAPEETAPIVYDVIEKKLVRSSYDWTGSLRFTASGEYLRWDNPSLERISANLLSIFPYGIGSATSTQYISGGTLIPQYAEFIMQHYAPGLQESHEIGVQVISSLPMILINRTAFANAGMNINDYCAIMPSGLAYDGGCFNNPNFRKLIFDFTLLSAQNGWDGMFLDGAPYAFGPGYCCCCQYCKEAWAAYSLEKLGKEVPIPVTPPDFQTAVSRCFFEFRSEAFLNFMLELREEAQKINPDFGIWPNSAINGAQSMYHIIHGIDTIITEFGAPSLLHCGEESTMYLYRYYEAFYEHLPLLSQHNDTSVQTPNDYQFYTCYAEAIANGGNLMAPVGCSCAQRHAPTILAYNKIVDENPDAFTKSTSIAETAILHSLYNLNTYNAKNTGAVSTYKNAPRRAAALLASNGIPYDFISVDKEGLSIEDFKQYKTVIIPEVQLISLELKTMLEEYMNAGGQLLILGEKFATNYIGENGFDYPAYEYDVFESWTGTKYQGCPDNTTFSYGAGKILVCRRYANATADEEAMTARSALLNAFETLGLYDQLRVTEEVNGKVETTIRSDAYDRRWWVHLINYNTGGNFEEKPYTVTVSIPEGQTVTDVVPSCAFRDIDKMQFNWEFKDGKLTVSGIFDIHTMLTIYKK
ncbi:MAG: beta-galactosidase trimerization domain-containing protein, partial [Clostridia bacterium]|nr:beta-galactosidase trimerization domain-containing protein [Clostridia bacterium]